MHKEIKSIQLKVVMDNIKKCNNILDVLVETESMSKMRRFGSGDYKQYYLRNPDRMYSSFMKTFLYFKDVDACLCDMRDTILDND